MISISDKSLCSGCTACEAICTTQCIVRRSDREGFDYPVANPDLCIQCGRCEEVCPMMNKVCQHKTVHSVADFRETAAGVLSRGGVVYGVGLESDMTVAHVQSSDIDMLNQNDYVQSDLYATFEEVRDYLAEDTEVLFCGTPCQAEGLIGYLGGEDARLKIFTFECMGVSSPGLWQKYNSFVDKKDMYRTLHRQGLTLRPSCYKCRHLAREVRCDMEKREEFFKGAQSAKDLSKHMSKYVEKSIIFNLKNIYRSLAGAKSGIKK